MTYTYYEGELISVNGESVQANDIPQSKSRVKRERVPFRDVWAAMSREEQKAWHEAKIRSREDLQWANAAMWGIVGGATIGATSALGGGQIIAHTISYMSTIGRKMNNLGNPFKNKTLKEADKAFEHHVRSGKLERVEGQPHIYKNKESGYSYYLDSGKKTGEVPHIDVNYPKPKPKYHPKKKIPVSGGR